MGTGLFDHVVANSNHSVPISPAAHEAGIGRVVFDRKRFAARGARPKSILADLASARLTTHHDSEKLAHIRIKRVSACG